MDFTYITDPKDSRLYDFRKKHITKRLFKLKKSQYFDMILNGTKGAETEEEVLRLIGVDRLHSGSFLYCCGFKWGNGWWEGYILGTFYGIPLYLSSYKIINNILEVIFTGTDTQNPRLYTYHMFDWLFRDDGIMPLHEQYAIDNRLDAIHYVQNVNTILHSEDRTYATQFKDVISGKIPENTIPKELRKYVRAFTYGSLVRNDQGNQNNIYYYKINPNYTYR